jgi:hypothetical protein
MSDLLHQPEPRPEVIETLRALAARGANVRDLTAEIIQRVGLNEDAVLPILWYFSKAFCLPLPVVLPIREWLGTDRDQEINALLLPEIQNARIRWATRPVDDTNGPAQDIVPDTGLTASHLRS